MAQRKSLRELARSADYAMAADAASNAAAKEATRVKALYAKALERIGTLEQQIEAGRALSKGGKPPRWRPPKRGKLSHVTGLLLLSDWHIEEEVRPATVNGHNEYTLAIAKLSAERVFQRAKFLLDHERHIAHCTRLVVALLGDFISGHIHEELRETCALAPLAACRTAADWIESGLRYLASDTQLTHIDVLTCPGNHGRTTPEWRYGTAAEHSFEQDMYYQLARRTSDCCKLTWQIGEAYHNWCQIENHQVRLHHGEQIRYGGGVFGLAVPALKALRAWDDTRRADYDAFGHLHTWESHHKYLANGSMIGASAYSIRNKCVSQPPYQALAFFDAHHGVTKALKIFCR